MSLSKLSSWFGQITYNKVLELILKCGTYFLETGWDFHFIALGEDVRVDEDETDKQAEEVKLQNAGVVTIVWLVESPQQCNSHRLQKLEENCVKIRPRY